MTDDAEPVRDNRRRGADVKRRREALGMKHPGQLAKLAGVDRTTAAKAEQGNPSTSEATFALLELALDKAEVENGHDEPDESRGLVMTVGGVRFEYPGHPRVQVETRPDGTQIISIAGEPIPDVSRFVNEHRRYRQDGVEGQ